jgi:type I restriction enzyme R subunit
MELIAADISHHIQQIPEGMKGQLACSSKAAAIRYKELFDELGLISSAVVISAPDSREGYEEVDAESRDLVVRWWEKNVGKEPEGKYTQRVLDDFATAGDPKLLIVVSKLLTGFDEPRNMVLYIDKPLKQHELLQAIARVNRLHDLKKFGYLVDYHGVLSELNSTMQDYRELAEKVQGYRADGMDSLFTRMSSEYKQLPRLQGVVWAILGGRKAGHR